ncbi:hypothetical protein HOY80DRAFT_956528 [Tuber brumale]|nr:hypothetical protein HOY80DRAFT_956528 [Tuber brumale]
MQRPCLACIKHARHVHICSRTLFPYLLLYFQLTTDLPPIIVRRPFTIHPYTTYSIKRSGMYHLPFALFPVTGRFALRLHPIPPLTTACFPLYTSFLTLGSFAVHSRIGSRLCGIVCPRKRFNDSHRSAGENGNSGERGRKEGCSAAGVFVGSVFLLLAGIRSGDLRSGAGNMMDGYGGP